MGDRWRMLAGRFMLRHCLRAYYEIDFARFTYGDNNKPHLVQSGKAIDQWPVPVWAGSIDVNLAHDRRHVLAAFSTSGDVGVDVACLSDFLDWAAFAEDYLVAQEILWVRAAPKSLQPVRALRFWTLKEAILKSTGHGLDIDPREIILAPGAPCPIVRLPASLPPASAFSLHEWRIDAQACAALAYVQRPIAATYGGMFGAMPAIRCVEIPAQRLMFESMKKEELCFATA